MEGTERSVVAGAKPNCESSVEGDDLGVVGLKSMLLTPLVWLRSRSGDGGPRPGRYREARPEAALLPQHTLPRGPHHRQR
eukprot:4784197-Pyramimonas_sp.AAC.1